MSRLSYLAISLTIKFTQLLNLLNYYLIIIIKFILH